MTEKTSVKQGKVQQSGSVRFSYSKWAWAYAAALVEADGNAGYIYADEGMDGEKAIAAVKKVAEQMRKRGQ